MLSLILHCLLIYHVVTAVLLLLIMPAKKSNVIKNGSLFHTDSHYTQKSTQIDRKEKRYRSLWPHLHNQFGTPQKPWIDIKMRLDRWGLFRLCWSPAIKKAVNKIQEKIKMLNFYLVKFFFFSFHCHIVNNPASVYVLEIWFFT